MLRRLAFCVSVLTAVGFAAVPAHAAPSFSVLVFTKADSSPAGVAAITKLAAQNRFAVETTADSGQFTAANLARFDAVVWLSANVLNAGQQKAFESYIVGGG